METKLVHLGATVKARSLPGGILIVAFVGSVTADSLRALKAAIAPKAKGARVVVADYSACVYALGRAELWDAMVSNDPDNLPDLPACLVVSDALAERMREATVAAGAAHGKIRALAPDLEHGIRWARQCVSCRA